MDTPIFRRPDLFQLLPAREYVRSHMPSGPAGCVVEDLDLVIRHFGIAYQLDATGQFMLVEQKHPGAWIGPAQERTFRLIHDVCRLGDPKRSRYIGYYVWQVAFGAENLPIFPCLVNRIHKLDETGFLAWMNFRLILPSLFDRPVRGA
jgi:hypothetical protein